MAWNPTPRLWGVVTAGTSGFITASSTAQPAAADSTLVAVVSVRPTTTPAPTPTITVTDSHGGTWELSQVAGEESSSTRTLIAVRSSYATGVTSVTATAPGTSQIHLHVLEYTGGPASATLISTADVLPDGDTWPALTIGAQAGDLVVGAASLGATSRALTLDAPYSEGTAGGGHKASGVHSLVGHLVTASAGPTGPTWTKTSGGSTSLVAVTAAIVEGDGPTPLAVDVGADRTITTDSTVQVTASPTGGSGARTFAWTVTSGPAGGDFVDPTGQTATFDPGGVPGTYVLRCTVTDDTGTAYDELTLTVTAPPTVNPTAVTGWAGVFGDAPDALTAITDNDPATGVQTSEDPDGEVLVQTYPAIEPPDGDLTIPLDLSATNGGTFTIDPALLVDGQTIPATTITITGATPTTHQVTWAAALLTGIDWTSGYQVRLTATRTD